ncbi:hypothetical protein QCA50_007385 [Cerrena zonata]|uniref:Peptidase S9 prolyl oligopeptidase catalytic domain-containing protein n=1 Tax=Cerrena zonata TaxID=2478898 RepID=A0AAW0G860_9APHY
MTTAGASRTAPYGTWKSSITAEMAAAQRISTGVEDVLLDNVTGKVYYGQLRPDEEGRSVIVDAITNRDLFGKGWDARTRVHEYGGAAAIVHNGVLFFSHFGDNRVYKVELSQTDTISPNAITPKSNTLRFADFTVHPSHTNLLVATAEDHTNPHPSKVLNYLVVIDSNFGTVTKLVDGADFYCCARFSPDGKHISWQQWNFPEFPWQSSQVHVASVTVSVTGQLSLSTSLRVAGSHERVVAQDPSWTSDNSLHFVTDVSGYCNPWTFTFDPSDFTKGVSAAISFRALKEEFGIPQWWLNRHGSGAIDEHHIAFLAFRNTPSPVLYVTDIRNGSFVEVPTPYSNIQYLHGDGKGKVVALGQPPDRVLELFELTLNVDEQPILSPLVSSESAAVLPPGDISYPQFLTLQLSPDDRPCYVTYLPPKHENYDGGLPDETPPVVVWVHGGPFNMEPVFFSLSRQFWTNRGWAYIDVHYGGSTGFGRAYRETLHDKWGLLDIQDSQQTVVELGRLGLVDPKRACICGESAGGYSTLQAATSLPDFFAAGAALYGVSDMKKLCDVLHKFEFYFGDRLMGGPYEEIPDVWKERSPIYHADQIQMPLLVLQGTLDPVVPAQQMIDMVNAIKKRGGKSELLLFEGEGHGFRKIDTIRRQLIKQLEFFSEAIGVKNDA